MVNVRTFVEESEGSERKFSQKLNGRDCKIRVEIQSNLCTNIIKNNRQFDKLL